MVGLVFGDGGQYEVENMNVEVWCAHRIVYIIL